MYINSVAIKNYKSLREFGPIVLGAGFNVIVGANNVGKTALIEAVSLRYPSHPHRSRETIPHVGFPPPDLGEIQIGFHLEVGEAKTLLMDSSSGFTIRAQRHANPAWQADVVLTQLSKPDIFLSTWDIHPGNPWPSFARGHLATLQALDGDMVLGYEIDRANQTIRYNPSVVGSGYDLMLPGAIRNRTYMFNAERLKVSVSPFGLSRLLQPDASNLAEVLNNLQSNRIQFDLFNRYVREIFPDIGWVGVPSGPGASQVQILLWPSTETDTGREDLAIPLAESGTGVGQVLAILYVVLIAEHPRVIIIDEPQSFLHPGAVRKLVEILQQFSQHQFIVTTHSPEVITSARPTTLTLLRKPGAETVAEQLDVREAEHLGAALAEVGTRLSDVFGADAILWVEGPTEERSFPLIVEQILRRSLLGIKIVGVLHTSDLEERDADRIVRIYRRLSGGYGLLPPAVGFIIDREERSAKDRDDIERRVKQTGSKIGFTPRRMYENYLLNAGAIAHVISKADDTRANAVTSEEVQLQLEQIRATEKHMPSRVQVTDETWIREVHGARVLADIFNDLTEYRVAYGKTLYGPNLTQWLIDNQPDELEEISKLLSSMLPDES